MTFDVDFDYPTVEKYLVEVLIPNVDLFTIQASDSDQVYLVIVHIKDKKLGAYCYHTGTINRSLINKELDDTEQVAKNWKNQKIKVLFPGDKKFDD